MSKHLAQLKTLLDEALGYRIRAPDVGVRTKNISGRRPETRTQRRQSRAVAKSMDDAAMTEIRVPTLGESVTEATIGRWFKQPGDAVRADEALAELETDKVTLEVNAPASGVLAEIVAKEGETVTPGALLGQITEGAASAKSLPLLRRSPRRRSPRRRFPRRRQCRHRPRPPRSPSTGH